MLQALAFLSTMCRLVPPDVGNHSLCVIDGRLTAVIQHHRMAQNFYLDVVDMDRVPDELAAEIAEMIKRNFAPVGIA